MTYGFQIRHSNHSTTLPPTIKKVVRLRLLFEEEGDHRVYVGIRCPMKKSLTINIRLGILKLFTILYRGKNINYRLAIFKQFKTMIGDISSEFQKGLGNEIGYLFSRELKKTFLEAAYAIQVKLERSHAFHR